MKRFNYPEEPVWPFQGAHPPHGHGGHAARDWDRYSCLTVGEATALSFGMNPLTSKAFWEDKNNYGTMQIGIWNSRIEEIIRAIHAGEIRPVDKTEEITATTLLHTADIEIYLSNSQKNSSLRDSDTNLQTEPEISIEQSEAFNDFCKTIKKAIGKFSNWRKTVTKVQKTGNFQDWLTKDIGFNTKDVELAKKILSELLHL